MIRQLRFIAAFLFILPGITGAQNQEPAEQLKALMESCQFSQAITLAELYLSKDSARVDLLLLKGRALAAIFRYKESIAILRKAQRFDSISIKVLNELVNVYRSTDPDKAIETAHEIILLDPDNRYFSLQLANLYLSEKDYPETIKTLFGIYGNDTTDFYVVKQLAICYDELKSNDSATLYYKKALRIFPLDPNTTIRLANLLIRTNEINTAYYITALFLQKYPDYTPILKQNAYCNYLIFDYPATIKLLRKCIRLGDSSKFTNKYLGLSFYKMDKYDTAAIFFRKAFQIDTTDAEVCFYYGVSETRSFNPDTGLVYLQRALRILMPSGQFLASLYAEMALAYSGTRPDTGLVLLKKAFEINPESNIIRFKIAYQYDYYLHKPDKAVPWYREYVRNIVTQPEHDPLDAHYQISPSSNQVPEVQFSMPDYARNRIREIAGKRK
jgi:tetratricopeptide (TPR) repeat protein